MIGAMGLCITYSTASDCLHGGSAAVKVKLHLATMHWRIIFPYVPLAKNVYMQQP